MSTPQELRETAREYRETADLIYHTCSRQDYAQALDYLYEATRRELYANMLEGKEKEMERCIQLHPKTERVKASEEPYWSEREVKRDMRGRYKLFSQPYAQRKEESEIERYRHKERVRQRNEKIEAESVREGFKQMPLFSFGSR